MPKADALAKAKAEICHLRADVERSHRQLIWVAEHIYPLFQGLTLSGELMRKITPPEYRALRELIAGARPPDGYKKEFYRWDDGKGLFVARHEGRSTTDIFREHIRQQNVVIANLKEMLADAQPQLDKGVRGRRKLPLQAPPPPPKKSRKKRV
jgi:hypothetical protein